MSSNKIVNWTSLETRLAVERLLKKKIVFTNGCFDLIHVGHVKVLTACKKFGDVLVLGLNSDASVRRLKGPKRPILTQRERAELLAEFESVDYVVIFPQDTPERLIKLVKPDVLVKGGDWKSSDIIGRELAKRVVRIPLLKGRSTTAIIEMIAKRYAKR